MNNLITIVNELDKVIGFGDYNYIHSRGILHRFVSIFLLDAKRRFLIQRRANTKYHPNLLSESTSAHVLRNEDYLDTANRKLKEELGLEHITLHEICKIIFNTFNLMKYFCFFIIFIPPIIIISITNISFRIIIIFFKTEIYEYNN